MNQSHNVGITGCDNCPLAFQSCIVGDNQEPRCNHPFKPNEPLGKENEDFPHEMPTGCPLRDFELRIYAQGVGVEKIEVHFGEIKTAIKGVSIEELGSDIESVFENKYINAIIYPDPIDEEKFVADIVVNGYALVKPHVKQQLAAVMKDANDEKIEPKMIQSLFDSIIIRAERDREIIPFGSDRRGFVRLEGTLAAIDFEPGGDCSICDLPGVQCKGCPY